MGSSSFIANLIAGYSLTYRRAFHLGDRIRIGDVTGDVAEIGLMVTRLRTVKNEEVVVPNSTVLGNNVVNYSTLAKSQGLILHTTAGIGYETPWRQVEGHAEARRGPDARPPQGACRRSSSRRRSGTSASPTRSMSTAIPLRPWSRLYTDLHRNILDVFNEYGVQIMTPAYEGDPDQPKIVPKDQWFLAPASPPEQRPEGGRTHGTAGGNGA